MVRAISNVETNIVSVERIKEYSEVEREADWTTDYKPSRCDFFSALLSSKLFSTIRV